jgi:hypothetical protein
MFRDTDESAERMVTSPLARTPHQPSVLRPAPDPIALKRWRWLIDT